jgi:gluconate:H+ symporter, GntP family
MIKHAGIGDSVRELAEERGLNYVLLAWLIAVLVRVAQGSATVAMITATGIMQSVAGADGWGCHPFYIYLAVGYGSFFCSWMNDSGFWVVSRMSGFSEKETLSTWTILLSVLSVVGLIQALLLSWLLPLGGAS